MGGDIKIISLTKKDLEKALIENTFWKPNANYVPFSKNKGKWLLENKSLEKDDFCGILALDGNNLVAFIALVPDNIRINDMVSKVYWSNRWWIHDNYKSSILSTYIKKIALDSVENKLLIKYIVPATKDYYDKQPYTKFSNRYRYIILFNIHHGFVVNKIKALKYILPVLKVLTKISHKIIAEINNKKIAVDNLSYNYIKSIDDELWEFINPYCKDDLVPKSKEYINWQIDNKQYVESDEKDTYTCLLSSKYSRIYNLSFLINQDGNKIGFISVLIRAEEFVLRYFLCDEENYEYCINALMDNFIKSKCSVLIVENKKIGNLIEKRFLRIYTNKRKIYSLAHKNLDFNFIDKTVYHQDGNFA